MLQVQLLKKKKEREEVVNCEAPQTSDKKKPTVIKVLGGLFQGEKRS